MTPHEVFRATLRVDELVHIESDWTFRVFDDGTLDVEIQRPVDWRARLSDEQRSSADALQRLERELAFTYVSADGVAERLPESLGESPGAYSCEFRLIKSGDEDQGNWTVAFTGTLSVGTGFRAQWRHVVQRDYSLWEPELEAKPYHETESPRAWSAAVEPVRATLALLTVGSYSLVGSIMEDTTFGFVVAVTMEWTLRADGSLVGTSKSAWGLVNDDGEPEPALLTGTWTRDGVHIVQSFNEPDAATHVFSFRGRATQYGFAGNWFTVSREELEELDFPVEDDPEKRVLLRVVKMLRPWAPHEHAFFPESFRDAARLLLLSSLRLACSARRLPSALWPRVLAFCDSEWFCVDA